VTFHHQLIEVAGLNRVQRLQSQVVEDEQLDPVQFRCDPAARRAAA
jgi:hypothetical protein